VVAGPDPHGCSGAAGGASATVPLFPLPNVFLFPGTRMPLHVFEPRYRELVQDLLDARGRLVMGTVLESHVGELACKPPVLPIAGLGEIFHHEKLPDGRYYIWLAGLARVTVREAPSDRLYRRVVITPVVERPVCPEREKIVREKIVKALRQHCRELDAPLDEVPLSQLSDLLLLRLRLPQCSLAKLYCELDIEQRCLGALAEHARRPPSKSG
jgi:Lon protease-like protein